MIKRVLILFVAIISSGCLFASHLVGGSLGYEYMGQVGANYRYKIILTVYNNCDNNSQIPIPVASHNVSIYQQDIGGNPMGGGNKSLFQTVSVPIVDSNLVQPPVSSGCAVGQSVCIYKAVYETLVDLPLNFNGYHLYFENFARNAAITNLLNPGGTAMAFHAYIAPSLVNNSSPVFQDDPVPFLCVNDTVSILNTAIDPDGDQLIFSFVTPFQGAGQAPSPLPWTIPTVNYNGGYSTAQPFGAGGFSFINGATGLTQYMSPTTGNFVVAVEIREYRNGNLIGVSRRDLQLLVITCPPNPAPNLSNTGGSGVTQYTISECDNLTFPITFTDPNGDSLTLTATGQIFDPNFMNPPATINSPVTGAATVTSNFSWTAPCGSAQALPYQFSVSATDNGCPPKTTNEVYQITVEPPTPPDTIIGPLTVCPNTTASYTTSPISGYTFNWVVTGGTVASGQGTDSITVNWGSSGTGTITLNSLNGCGCPSDVISINVNILPSPFADAGNDTTICLGDSVQLGGSPTGPGGSTITWSPTTGLSNPNIANPIAFPSSTTTYIVTVDNGICPTMDTVTVFVGSALINAGNDTTMCIGDSVQLNATGGVSYSWSPTTGLSNPNIANPIAFPNTTTTYVVTVTDALSCTGVDSVTVTVVSPPVITITNDTTICDGACIQLNATGGTSYSWSPTTGLSNPNIANPIACPTVNTTYVVTVSNAANCTNTDSVTITINPLPTITASNDTTICDGACAQLNASGGTSYSWSPTTGLSNPNIANPTACPTITTTYVVTGTDVNNCTNTDTVVVTVSPLPTANAGNDTTICIGDSIQLNATGGTSYTWTPSGSLTNPNIANPIAFPNTTTTYVVTVTDGLGCVDTDTVIVTVTSLPVITITNDTTICDGACAQLNATGGTSYSWSPTTGLSNPNIANPTACPAVNTIYVVTVSNAANCTATDSVTITINPLPTITASNDTTICDGACAQLNATGGTSYSWSPITGLSNPNIANPTACPTVTTTYVVTGTDANSCTNTDTVIVTVSPLPTANAGPDTSICGVGSVVIGGSPSGPSGSTFSWSPGSTLNDSTLANPTASPIVNTTYVLTVTDTNGCENADTVNVTINTPPVVDAGNDTNICTGSSVIIGGNPTTPSSASTYSWTPAGTLNSTTIANPAATPTVSPTTYYVTVTDSVGCTNIDSVTITLNPLPTITASNDTTICDGACAQLNASGGTSYTWSPTTGLSNPNIANPTACPTVTTTYVVTGTDANNCTNTDTVVVTVSPLPTANAGNDTTICIGDSVQLNATGGTSYTWTPSGSLTNPNIANPIAFPNTTTTYVVTVTDGLGCIDTDTVIVTVASLPVITITNDTTICDGACVQLNATGGTSYSWSPTTGLSNPNIANPIVCPTVNTTYVVTVSNAANCTATDSVIITINPLPTITASNDTTICDGACAQLNATGGTSYVWSPSTGLSDSTISNPTACVTSQTTYMVTGTDANSCVNTDTVTVSINPLPTITASPDVWVCVGDSAQIFANGGTSYTWLPTSGLSNPNISNPMAAPANTTTYVVTGTDVNGCSNTDSVVVTANDTVPISLANDTTICSGDSVQLGGNPTSVTGTTFNWFPAGSLNNPTSANPIAFPTVTTTYYVTATNDTCSTTDSITITVHPISNISAGNDLSMCFGDTVQLSASGGASYVWSPGNSLSDSTIFNPLAFPTTTTSYTVNALDTNGCNNSDTVLVTVNPLPTINAGNDVSICDGDTAQLQVTGASSYLWTPSAGLSDTTIANPLAFPTVTTSYVVTGTDTNSCSNTDTVVVNVNALPTITAFSDTAVCSGVSVQLNATGGSAYTWVPAATLNNANIPNPIASPITTTTYQVTGVDTNGCSNVDSVTITINALPTVNAGTDVAICIGDTAQLQASGGNGYLWTPSAGLSDTTISNPLAFPTVTTTYIVMGTDTNACEGTDTIVVTVNPLPTISAGLTDTVYICNGDSAQLNATGGTSYVWTPNTNITNNTIANPFVFPLVTTIYYVTGTDANSCSNSDSVVVSVFAIPNLTDTVLCVGDSIQLTAYGPPGATYTWTPPTDLSNPNIANPYTSTTVTITYTVTVQDTNGCIDTTQITVTAEDKPNAAFIVETTPACDGILAVFDNTSTGADSYLWLFGDGSQSNETHPTYTFTYGASFTTILNAYSTNGCLDTASFNISSLSFEEQFNLTPPSVLTPNRDGHNDEFKLDLPEAISACTNIEIFNRWGMKMFESKGQNIGWDGRTTAGEEVPDGTYFYIVDVKGIVKKGSITLMR